MKNYYEILNVDVNSSYEDIQITYNERIKQFNCLPFLTNEMKSIIKNLKEAKYVLLDEERRTRYDNLLYGPIEEPIIEEPIIEEQEQPIDFPHLGHRTLPKLKEKESADSTKVCDRIFSINFPPKPQ